MKNFELETIKDCYMYASVEKVNWLRKNTTIKVFKHVTATEWRDRATCKVIKGVNALWLESLWPKSLQRRSIWSSFYD